MTIKSYTVYGLFDPRTGALRYVGKTHKSLKQRLGEHMWCAGRRNTHCYQWIKSLVALNTKPHIGVLEECASANALIQAECDNIAYYKYIGCNLTNLTAGGDGRVGHTPSQITRQRLSSALTGKRVSQGTRIKLSNTRLGKSLSVLAKLALSQHSRSGTDDVRTKISRSAGGASIWRNDGRTYLTCREAAKASGVSPAAVSNVVRGKSRTAGGYQFRYLDKDVQCLA